MRRAFVGSERSVAILPHYSERNMYLRDTGESGKRLRELPEWDRPREKLQEKGVGSLSDRELLAVLLGRGHQGIDVMRLAGEILSAIDENGGLPDFRTLQEFRGMGPAKASVIMAALEFARRRIRPEGVRVASPSDVLPLIRHYSDRKQEHLLCITLNGANEVIATRVVTIGLLNRTQIHPREVYADALTDRAAAVIMAHNHPSGNPTPSRDDLSVTRRIRDAGEVLGVPLLDHLVFTRTDYYSFKEEGDL